MKTLFVLASVIVILFLVMPNEIEAQKRKATKKTNQSAAIASAGECSVVVRNDLLPNNRGVVVVGCDSFGIHEHFIDIQGRPVLFPSNGGILVFDADGNLIFKWQAQMLLGVFDHFAGIRKVRGHNALMVRIKGGSGDGAVLPLYFNGKTFTFAWSSPGYEMPSPQIDGRNGSTVWRAPQPDPSAQKTDLLDTARDEFNAAHYEDALKTLRLARTADPTRAEVYLYMGMAYDRLNNSADAVPCLKTALFWDPKLIAADILLGRIYLRMGDRQQALSYVQTVLKIDASNAEASALKKAIENHQD